MARAHALRYAALAITDECSVAGIVRAHLEAQRLGLPLLIGSDFQLQPHAAAPPPPSPPPSGADPGDTTDLPLPHPSGPRLVMLAMSRRGYANLVQWITVCRRRAPKGSYRAEMADLEGRVAAAPMLAGLPGCLALLVVSAALPAPSATGSGPPADLFETLFAHALWLKTWFGDRAALALPLLLHPHDALLADAAQRVSTLTGLPIVAVGDVRMHARSRQPLRDALTATRLRRSVAASGTALASNAEAHLRPRTRLARLYRPEWLHNTLALAARCTFSLHELRYEYPREIVPDGHTPTSWLRTLVEQGAVRRFPGGLPDQVRGQIEHELALIAQLQYEAYFLTVADIVQLGARPGHPVPGPRQRRQLGGLLLPGASPRSTRHATTCCCSSASSASSATSRPTSTSTSSTSAAKRSSSTSTASTAATAPRSPASSSATARVRRCATWAARWARPRPHRGRRQEPALVRRPPHRRRTPARERLRPRQPAVPAVGRADADADRLPAPPAASTRAASSSRATAWRSWCRWKTPRWTAAASSSGTRTTSTRCGCIKVDILALGMLSAIRRALRDGRRQARAALELHHIPDGDEPTYDMLCRADSVGVFQVESRAQMSMLPRLQPRCYYDLVIEVAIVRPGPIQGGMVHPYLKRRNGEESSTLPFPELAPALGRTLGVPIFQEQVMQLAMIAADFTAGEADQLRRAMAAWKRKGGLGPFHERLVGRMVEKGYDRDYAERIFKQIEGFGEYGFPESHAASFALLVYASAWLKCHHPDAFLAALLNSQPMGFYAPAQLVRDAREHGVQVLPVDVRHSAWDSTLEGAPDAATGLCAVRLGLGRVSGLPQDAAERLVAARGQGAFASAEDLARRAGLDAHALALLAQADALQGLAGHRQQAAWAVAGVDTRATPLLRATRTHEDGAVDALPLPAPQLADTVLADYRSTGLSLSQHPVALLRAAAGGVPRAAGGGAAPLPERPAGARQRPGHAPAAARDGHGRRLRDAGRRDRRRQRHRLAAAGAGAAPAAAGQHAAHGLRRLAVRRRGAAPGGAAAGRPLAAAAGPGHQQPQLPVTPRAALISLLRLVLVTVHFASHAR